MSDRKLATIRRIDRIEPIEGADKIVKATVGGWQLVTAIDNGFKEGDFAVYAEVDSWIPTEIAPFLSKGQEPRTYNGVKGERLKTIRLKGQISQGLLLPLSLVGDVNDTYGFEDGQDVTENLGIQKWEAPIPAQLAGVCRGTFPSRVPKTDQERIQNLSKELKEWIDSDLHWEVTEKCEGSSCSIMFFDGEIHVASRNMDLKDAEGNTFWKVAKQNDLIVKLETFCREHDVEIALQGELIGPGVQGNIYNLKDHEFRLFDIYDIKEGKYIESKQRLILADELQVKHVPIVAHSANLKDTLGLTSMESVLEFVQKKSSIADVNAEGMVFKCIEDPSISFKAISNIYLLKQKD